MNISKLFLPPDSRDKAKTDRQTLLKDPTTVLTNSGELNIDMKFMEKESYDSLCQKNEKSCLQISLCFKVILSHLCIWGGRKISIR